MVSDAHEMTCGVFTVCFGNLDEGGVQYLSSSASEGWVFDLVLWWLSGM